MGNNHVKNTALCGVFAGVAITIMCLGGLIPIATYITPMLCIITEQLVLLSCGKRFAWTWYVAVSILALLLSPDKEAALLFLFLGNYPCLKLFFDKIKPVFIWKILYFNAVIGVVYFLFCKLLGLDQILQEYQGFGMIGLIILIVAGNITFFLLDRILSYRYKNRNHNH